VVIDQQSKTLIEIYTYTWLSQLQGRANKPF